MKAKTISIKTPKKLMVDSLEISMKVFGDPPKARFLDVVLI